VCDGFVGNVVLKLIEGLSEGIFQTLRGEITEEGKDLLPLFEPIVDRIWARHDFKEYGGAPLLGISKIVIICHGRSDHRAIANAIRVSVEQHRANLIPVITEELRKHGEDAK
ncbi:MAG: phosphate--acyl-ACP acyltransferase, partial [Phycisphaerae bacterium]|nr:phosphate--acyl-ACP acyltransferase [Phycisphaerae bacterium]